MPRRRYDWETYLDGAEHTFKQGTDFDCGLPSIVGILHFAAKTRGLTVKTSTNVSAKSVTFQAFKTVEYVPVDPE